MARIALVHDIAGVAAIQAELLRGAGHQVDEIALPTTGATWSWPQKGLALLVRLAAYLPAINRIRTGDYDVVHIHWLPNGIVGVLAGRRFFVQAHGSDLHVNLRNPIYRLVTNLVLRRADRVFYVTPNLRSLLRDYSDKVVYLPNPVEACGSGAASVPSQIAKVLIFTRLDPIKGVDRIFPAVERLSGSAEVTALEWGPLAHDYVARYGRWVTFAQPIPHERIGAFLGQFDLVIGQMQQGILSLMELEALGAGRPLITALDSTLYPLDPPPVIWASGPEAILGAVERLRSAPQELAERSASGHDWVARNHGYAHHLQLLESVYFEARAS